MNNSTAIVAGSLSAIAQQNGQSIAETFLSADCIVIVDTSGSMAGTDSRGGQSRYNVACEELAKLQKTLPGKIAVLSFSDSCIFCPGGQPIFLMGGTRLDGALRFAKVADVPGAMRFIVISDGCPDSEAACLAEAAKYHNRIDVIYVGPEASDWGFDGRDFLNRLAKASGGQMVTSDVAQDLSDKAQYLLAGG